METIIGSMQQDIPVCRSSYPNIEPKQSSTSQQIGSVERLTKEKKNKGKKIESSSICYPLEDYLMDMYTTIRDWLLKNPSR